MESASRARRIVRFGNFEVDLAGGELRKQGLRVPLQDQPFQILSLLIRRQGEVVGREELRQALWAEDTFVDFEHGLNTAIKKLRRALGDSALHPRYVVTHYKRGYRFAAPVEELAGGQRQEGSETVPPRGQRFKWPLVISAALVLLLAGDAYVWRRTTPEPRETPVVPVPFTSLPGTERHPSFSPEGSRVAFSWDGPNQDNFDIYVKAIGSETLQRLTSDSGEDQRPAWSPDGRSIAFLRSGADPFKRSPGEVLLIPALGGAERRLTTVRVHGPISWLPDGNHLAISDQEVPDGPVRLYLVEVGSGRRQPITNPHARSGIEAWDLFPVVSPDGRSIVYRHGGWHGDLFLLALSPELVPGLETIRLTPKSGVFGYPAWTGDGRQIIFQSRELRPDTPSLWRIRLAADHSPAEKPELIEWSAGGGETPAVSRTVVTTSRSEQEMLIYTKAITQTNIYGIRFDADSSLLEVPLPLIASTVIDNMPQYSPDGKRISFISTRSGKPEVWVAQADGSGASRLTETGWAGCPRWSPDGEYIVFDSVASGDHDVYVISSQGGRPRRLTSERSQDGAASWSRNGNLIYFASDRTGSWQVWKMRPDGSGTVQVTKHGGHVALEDPDGRWIYYSKSSFETSLWKIPVEGGEETQVIDSLVWMDFDVTRKGIYFVPTNRSKDGSVIQFFSFTSDSTRTVFALPQYLAGGLSVAPDGRSLLFTQADYRGSDLMMVEDFH